MRPAVDVADAALDKWLRTGLHGRYGAVAAAPVPYGFLRLSDDEQDTSRAGSASREGPRGEEDRNPALGFAVAVALSGLLWAAIVALARTLLG